jgi:hypothetical protein
MYFQPSEMPRVGRLVGPDGVRQARAVPGHHTPNTRISAWIRYSIFRRSLVGRQHQEGFEADVAGVAHADGHAQHGHVQHQQQRQALGPGRRAVEDVAAEHLVTHARSAAHMPAMPSHMQRARAAAQARVPAGRRVRRHVLGAGGLRRLGVSRLVWRHHGAVTSLGVLHALDHVLQLRVGDELVIHRLHRVLERWPCRRR